MKYAFEIGLGVTIYVQIFINIGSGVQTLTRETYRHTDSIKIDDYHLLGDDAVWLL
jgi:hypothetical protein